MQRTILCLIFFLLATCLHPPSLHAATEIKLSGTSALVMDAETGEILFAKAGDEKRFPASITKLMTAILLVEKKKPDDLLTASSYAASQEPSNISLHPGEKMTAKDALYALLLHSANDVAVMIAENIAGTTARFSSMMNAKAAQLGMKNTHFVTPNGLHDPQHYSTARDLAILTRAALQIPQIREALHCQTYRLSRPYGPNLLQNQNQLLQHDPSLYWGGKSGFTDQAGSCLTEVAVQNGVTLISVTLQAGSLKGMYDDIRTLTAYGFQQYRTYAVHAGDPFINYPAPEGFIAPMMYSGGSFQMFARKNGPAAIHQQVILHPWQGPLPAGAEVGTLLIRQNGKVIQTLPLIIKSPITARKSSPVSATLCILLLSGISLYRRRRLHQNLKKQVPQRVRGHSLPG